MKKQELVELFLKMFGVYFFIISFSNFQVTFFGLIWEDNFMSRQWLFLISSFIPLIIGVLLFIKAKYFSLFIVQENSETDIIINTTVNTFRIALIILGFWVLSYSIPQFLGALTTAVVHHIKVSSIPNYLLSEGLGYIYLVAPSIKIIIGIWLILGTKGIVKFISRYDVTFRQINNNGPDELIKSKSNKQP